jgi:integrase
MSALRIELPAQVVEQLVEAVTVQVLDALGAREDRTWPEWMSVETAARYDDGLLHVRGQWTATGEYAPTKTPAGVRRIALPADLRDELIALRLRSRFSQDDQPIFASQVGTALGHRNVTRRGFEPARDLAGLPSSLTFHDLRHAAASRLIGAGLDPVTVAGVLGHEDATTTLRVYAHLFDRPRTDEAVRVALAGVSR